MPRTDPMFSVRCPPARLARIDERARLASKSRSQYILDVADPEGLRGQPVQTMTIDEVAEAYPQAQTLLEQPTSTSTPVKTVELPCPHPKDRRERFSWGARCKQCGARV